MNNWSDNCYLLQKGYGYGFQFAIRELGKILNVFSD